MPQLLASIFEQFELTDLIDIGITAILIYWLFSLIRGTRAVSLVIGVTVLFAVYAAARAFQLQLLTQILQAGAVVGLFALVVVFQRTRYVVPTVGRTVTRNSPPAVVVVSATFVIAAATNVPAGAPSTSTASPAAVLESSPVRTTAPP